MAGNPFDQFDAPRGGFTPIPGMAPNPKLPLEVRNLGVGLQKAEGTLPADISRAGSEAAKAASDARYADQLNAATVGEKRAAAQAAQDRAALQRKMLSGQQPITPDKRAQLLGDYKSLGMLDKGVANLTQQYQKNFADQGILGTLGEYLPAGGILAGLRPENGVFDQTANNLTAFVSKGLGLTSRQFDTPKEQEKFIGSFIPHHGDTDQVIVSKINALRGLAINGKNEIRAQLGLPPLPMPKNANVAASQRQRKVATPPQGSRVVNWSDLP